MLARTVPRRLSDCRTISVCTFSLPRYQYLAYYLADLILFYATPLLTATVLYSLIARKLLCHSRPVGHRGSRRPTAEYEAAKRDGISTPTAADSNDASSNVQVFARAIIRGVVRNFFVGGKNLGNRFRNNSDVIVTLKIYSD